MTDRDPSGSTSEAGGGGRPLSLMTRRRTVLFAVAAGSAVANLYWAQPLLDFIAADLGATTDDAGWLVTMTQIGYALGIVLIVPLGDVLERRRLIPIMLGFSAATLLACAAAPTMTMLLVVIALLGVSTVSGQILTPLASDLSAPERRGRTVGTVVSGILIGILVSRTLSGLMADWLGWRAVYAAAAAVALLMAVVLARAIPPTGAKTHAPYPALLASVGRVITDRRIVRWSLALGILAFGSFTMFWTALTFLLSSDPYNYPVSVIGLFGLLGLVGALAARGAGRFHDRGWSLPVTGVAWLLLAASYGVGLSGNESIIAVVAAIVLLDLATQGVLILSQTRLFAAVPDELRSRANTAFVATNFVGGALGSAAAGVWWRIGGWSAVCLAGIAAALLGLGVWALGRRGPLRPQQRPSR